MAPKFGNYLFRNLKAEPGSQRAAARPSDQGPGEDQEITLQPGDFTSEIGSALNWGAREPREIWVKLKHIDGLMEGRVSISAKVLRELYPGLVPDLLKGDTVFPLSLRSVVLQLQNVMRTVGDGSDLAGAPDFDTPIAQVAREDEGFFKLEEHGPQAASKQAVPASSDEFGSVLPLIREKVQDREDLSRQGKAAGETPSIQPVQVVAPFPSQPSQPPKSIDPVRTDPFADLQKPKLGMSESATAGPKLSEQESLKPTETQTEMPKPQRRRGLEQLQELFLTDDFLDAGQVAQLLRAFPKVKAALIMLEDGTVLGGALPENYQSGAAVSAPALMRAVREFGTAISSAKVSAFTLLADSPISIFLEGRICMLVVHEGRGLLPGMRQRFTEIAKALDALYDPGDKTS